jgi:hypothetical protein
MPLKSIKLSDDTVVIVDDTTGEVFEIKPKRLTEQQNREVILALANNYQSPVKG